MNKISDKELMQNDIESLEKQKAGIESKLESLKKMYNCDHNFAPPIKREPIEQHKDVYYILKCRRCGCEVRSIKTDIKKIVRIEFPGGFIHELDL